jgi:hypothetical protein
MGPYLERYRAGECQQIWAELLAEGAAIREEPLASDAWAVAQETMRRVRHNLELLIPRLQTLGYRFGEIPHAPGHPSEIWERDFVKAYPVFQPPPPNIARILDELEQRVGILPLSIRAFYQEIGGVNFIGVDPWADGGVYYDPLFMWPLANVLEERLGEDVERDPGEEGDFLLCFSPDAATKYDESGAENFLMTVPNASIDGVFDIYKKTTFVEYLRTSLRSGGLSGLEQTEKIDYGMNTAAYLRHEPAPSPAIIARYEETVKRVLAQLCEGLLPI